MKKCPRCGEEKCETSTHCFMCDVLLDSDVITVDKAEILVMSHAIIDIFTSAHNICIYCLGDISSECHTKDCAVGMAQKVIEKYEPSEYEKRVRNINDQNSE